MDFGDLISLFWFLVKVLNCSLTLGELVIIDDNINEMYIIGNIMLAISQ